MSSENPFEILSKTFEGGKGIDKKINASLGGGLESETEEEEETKKAQMQNSESLENLEERERVIALLHDFYQERQKNMAVHREVAELTENLKGFFEKAIYFDKKWFKTTEYRVVEDILSKGRYNVGIRFRKENGNMTSGDAYTEINNLRTVLNSAELEEKEKKELEELIKNIEKTENALDLKVDELWEIRENIAKELILITPEFADFKDAKLSRRCEITGLYNLDSEIWADKIFETEKEREERHLYFLLGSSGNIEEPLHNLEQKFNITDNELKEIKNLEWIAEDKEKLKNLMEDVGDYKAEAEKLKEGLLKSANFKFKEKGVDLIKDEFIRAFIRQLYEDYKLPIIHKERVVQEIMNGTLSF